MSEKVVIYIGGFELPDKNAAAHRVLNNAKILRELGYKVVFIGVSKTCKNVQQDNFFGFDSISVPYPESTKKWLKHLCDINEFKNVAEQYKEALVGVIFYNYQTVAMSRIMKYCKKRNLWTVADVTEWYLADKKNPIHYIIKQADTSIRMRYLQKKVSGVIAISRYLYDYYTKYVPTILLPPLVDKQEDKWKLKDRTADSHIRLVFAGTVGAFKDNLELVLKALMDFKDSIEISIIGIEKDDMLKYLPADEQKDILGEHIHFLGRLPHTECLQIISESDFQIFLREDNLVTKAGFPTKLGESFACGTPVITNLTSNIGDYLVDGENGYIVKELNADSVRSVFVKISAADSQMIEKMKKHCKEIELFNYKYYIEDMKNFMETIK
ncbi:MAG: glycosyltransferase [Lachnospiraceae bacterium]|nr:glycosyltransferase [Lachnospiraceae bacterium]